MEDEKKTKCVGGEGGGEGALLITNLTGSCFAFSIDFKLMDTLAEFTF